MLFIIIFMEIGNLFINKLSNQDFFIEKKEHRLFDILLQSFQLPNVDKFYANTCCSLEEHLNCNTFSITMANQFLNNIYNQLQIFEENYLSIISINLNDILVIDDQFYFCNINKLCYFDNKTELMKINSYYDKSCRFLCPELKSNNKLPFILHKNSFFYNLALVLFYCLKKTNHIFQDFSNEEILEYFQYTKFYYTMFYLYQDQNRQFIIF